MYAWSSAHMAIKAVCWWVTPYNINMIVSVSMDSTSVPTLNPNILKKTTDLYPTIPFIYKVVEKGMDTRI